MSLSRFSVVRARTQVRPEVGCGDISTGISADFHAAGSCSLASAKNNSKKASNLLQKSRADFWPYAYEACTTALRPLRLLQPRLEWPRHELRAWPPRG